MTLRLFGTHTGEERTQSRGAVVVAVNGLGGKMRIQLKVQSPTGQERIVGLCDSEAQLRKITVMQLKDKLTQELMISTSIFPLLLTVCFTPQFFGSRVQKLSLSLELKAHYVVL